MFVILFNPYMHSYITHTHNKYNWTNNVVALVTSYYAVYVL